MINTLVDGYLFRIITYSIISLLLLTSFKLLKRHIRLASEVLLTAGCISVNSEIYTHGGLNSYATVILVIIPVFTLPVSGKNYAYVWLGTSFMGYLGFYLAHESGIETPNLNQNEHFFRRAFFDTSCILFGLFVLSMIFMGINIKYTRKVKEQLNALRKEAYLRHKAEQDTQKVSEAKSFFLTNMSLKFEPH